MSKEKYVFNPSTLQYEKVEKSGKYRFYQGVGYVSSLVLTSIVIFTLGYYYFPTPKEKALEKEMTQMEYYYKDLSSQFEFLNNQIDNLQKKDAEVHRVVFGMEPIDENVWNGGTGGREGLIRLANNRDVNSLLNATLDRVEKLKRKINMQSNSMEVLLAEAKDKENKLASIPSIKPVQEDKLKRKVNYLSGFGMRIHPVHKVRKMHKGIDFTAPTGTFVQSTGDGIVERVERKRTGYGRNIVINHGYGYRTLYGHLNTINVKKGDKVTKGQHIGTVGSSGTSTAPHCHYEVRVNGVAINPIDYVLDGLSPREYEELVARAEQENQSFD